MHLCTSRSKSARKLARLRMNDLRTLIYSAYSITIRPVEEAKHFQTTKECRLVNRLKVASNFRNGNQIAFGDHEKSNRILSQLNAALPIPSHPSAMRVMMTFQTRGFSTIIEQLTLCGSKFSNEFSAFRYR